MRTCLPVSGMIHILSKRSRTPAPRILIAAAISSGRFGKEETDGQSPAPWSCPFRLILCDKVFGSVPPFAGFDTIFAMLKKPPANTMPHLLNRRQFSKHPRARLQPVLHLPKARLPGGWRTFEVKARVELPKSSGVTRVWVPAALISPTPFQKTLLNEFSAEGGTAKFVEGKADALGIVAAEFPSGVKPAVTLTAKQDRDKGTIWSIFPRRVKLRRWAARSWSIFSGRRGSCRPTAS